MGETSTAFVIGNGKSRLIFDLEKLKQHGETYGCNAIYRDFLPDNLFAVDGKMVKEFYREKIAERTKVWINRDAPYDRTEGMNVFPKEIRKGTGCGFAALLKAVYDGHNKIYMLGFDLHDPEEKPYQYFNNVYAGTENYKGRYDSPPSSARYVPKLLKILEANKDKTFVRAWNAEHKYIPEQWLSKNITNLQHISNVELGEELDVLVQKDTYTR